MSDSSIVGEIAIWLVPVALLTAWCVQDGNWVLIGVLVALLLLFLATVAVLWVRTVRHDRVLAARRAEVAELEVAR